MDAALVPRVLVVEDDEMVAMVLAEMLEEAGMAPLGPIRSVASAIACIEDDATGIEAALLDVNLGGELSYAVADRLEARGIGFIFTSGYGPGDILPAYRRHPCCSKPFNEAKLSAMLNSVLARPGAAARQSSLAALQPGCSGRQLI